MKIVICTIALILAPIQAMAVCSADTTPPTCHNKWQAAAITRLDNLAPPADINGWRASVVGFCDANWISPSGRQLYKNAIAQEYTNGGCAALYNRIQNITVTPLEGSPIFWAYATFQQTNGGQIFAQFLHDRCATDNNLLCCLRSRTGANSVPSGVVPDANNYSAPLGYLNSVLIAHHCELTPGWDQDGDGVVNAADFTPFRAPNSQTFAVAGIQNGAILDIRDTNIAEPGIPDWAECGDCNFDGAFTVSDLVCLNTTIFAPPTVADNQKTDATGDGQVTVSDIIAVNAKIFTPSTMLTCPGNPICKSTDNTCGQ